MTQRQTSEAGVGWGLVCNLHIPSDIYSLPPSFRLPHFRQKSVAILQAHHLSPAGPPHRNIPAVLSRPTTSPTLGYRPQHHIRFTNAAVYCIGSASPTASSAAPDPLHQRRRALHYLSSPTPSSAVPDPLHQRRRALHRICFTDSLVSDLLPRTHHRPPQICFLDADAHRNRSTPAVVDVTRKDAEYDYTKPPSR
jgi:hypothetical protein